MSVSKRRERLRERSERRDADAALADQPTSSIAADEHAWWAARENLASTFQARPRGRAAAAAAVVDEPKGGFEEYFSAESLFTRSESFEGEISADATFSPPDPYIVLGVPTTATWDEITGAHRRLAKLHHPDRLLHATTEDRAESESRMRELNIAYTELRRRHHR